MFRRKEEGSKEEGFADSHHDTHAPATAGGVNGSGSQGTAAASVSAGQTQASSSAPSPFSSSSSAPAIPSTQSVVRSLSDVARNSPLGASSSASAGSSYRPSPVTDFNNRNASRAGQDARSPAGHSLGSALDKQTVKSSPRILTVGNDILLKGEIATCDRVVIEGRVEAKLSDVHTVEIAATGSFKGTAEVEDVEVSGLFEGDLVVKNRLVIYATGEVRGNISYGEIEIERGGRLTGQIKTAIASGSVSHEKPNLLDVLDAKSRAGKDRDQKDAVA